MKSLIVSFVITLTLSRLQATDAPSDESFVLGEQPDGEWRSLVQKAAIQLQQHKLAEAAESSKRALQIAKHFDSSDTRLAITYYQLGNINRDWGHCADSRVNYSHAIATWEKQSSPKPKFLFNTM